MYYSTPHFHLLLFDERVASCVASEVRKIDYVFEIFTLWFSKGDENKNSQT